MFAPLKYVSSHQCNGAKIYFSARNAVLTFTKNREDVLIIFREIITKDEPNNVALKANLYVQLVYVQRLTCAMFRSSLQPDFPLGRRGGIRAC